MSRIDALVSIDRKAWHSCGEELARALFAWRDFAEFAWGNPSESDRDLTRDAIDVLMRGEPPQDESDVLMTWRVMLEVKRAA